MNKLTTLALVALASTAAAQNCFDPNFGTNIGAGDDTVLSGGAIGFNFPFNGLNYTDIYVSTNGFVYLANASTPVPTNAMCCTGNTAGLVASLNPVVAPLWNDLNVIAANGAGVYVNSSAAACIITWDQVVEFGNTVPFQIQVQLLPSGEIRFTYSGNTAIRVAGDCLVGVSEGNNAAVPAPTDFSTPGATSAVTAFEIFNGTSTLFDMAGDSLSLTPAGTSWINVATPCRGAAEVYGTGCIRQADSFYELFATAAAHDLANTSMQMLYTGSGYIALPGTATYVAPTAAATSLALTDDSAVTVALSVPMPVAGGVTGNLRVCSNGWVSTAAVGTNTTTYTPNVATFLAMADTVWCCWHDYNPTIAGSGTVKFEELGGVAYVTWDGVFDFGTTGPGSTFQFQFDLASGTVNVVWGSISGVGNAHLVGYSVGGPSFDTGSVDLTAALPATISVFNTQVTPLALNVAGVPGFGQTVSLDTTNIPASAQFGATLLGFVEFNPGLDLTSIGMPGCYRYTDGAATLLFLAPVGSASTPFSVPNNPAFFGTVVTGQSVVFTPGLTPLGAIASNGVRLTLGY